MYEYGTAAQMPLAFLEILDLRARRSRWYRIEYSLAGSARTVQSRSEGREFEERLKLLSRPIFSSKKY